jgi:AcrR family transcriptional regulator
MSRGSTGDGPLLDLAAQIVAEQGAEAFTMEELAARAGVSRATLYRRFGNHRALLERLVAERGIDLAPHEPDKRRRILDAARVVIGRVGPAQATMEQIAEQADVGAATVYRHFGSKQGLLEAFAQTLAPRRVARQLEANPGPDVAGELQRFATETLRFMQENGDLLRVTLLSTDSSAAMAELRDRPHRTLHLLARYLEKQMLAGRIAKDDPQRLAASFMGMLFMHGILGPAHHELPAADPPQTGAFITRLFLHGITAPAPRAGKR